MKVVRRIVIPIAVIVAFILVICFGRGYLKGFLNRFNESENVSSEQETTQITFEDIGELNTQSAIVTEVNVTKNAKKLFGQNLPFTQSKYIYSYDFNIKAGYDFSKIVATVDESTKTIRVNLPEAEIMSCEEIDGSLKVYEEKNNIFTPQTLEVNDETLSSMKEQAKKDAIESGLKENAKENAKVILKSFIEKLYAEDEYHIEFDGDTSESE